MGRAIWMVGAAVLILLPLPGHAQVRREGGGTVESMPGTSLGPQRVLPSSPADTQYKLGAEDVVQIQVWERPELSGLATVDLSGQIQAPLIGTVKAAGRTPAEMSADLTEQYQLLDRSITEVLVSVAQYNSKSVTMLGQVRSPGVYGFRQMPSLWEALLTAGGPTPDAELSRVQIVRGDSVGGDLRAFTVNLTRGIEKTPASSLPALLPKDKVIVPSVEETPIGGESFQVFGAVNAPGMYRITMARTVVEAIAVSGGPAAEADLSKVHLVRTTGTSAVAYELDLEGYLKEAKPLVDMPLRVGDTITIPQKGSFFKSLAEGMGRLAPFLSLATTIILATR